MTLQEEKDNLFTQFYYLMGAPIREVEIELDQLEVALQIAIQDYSMAIQNFLIESQWTSLYGQDVTTVDMSFAMSVRNFDYASQFSYAYSKRVGLQTNGPWELKKDYIDIQHGRQVYQIPAGREVNEVLWFTPSTVDAALFASYGGFDSGFGGGMSQMGSTGGSNGMGATGGYYIAPAFDVLLRATDMKQKNSMLRGELTHKITAGPDGTRLLHLLNIPGSRLSFSGGGDLGNGRLGMVGCRVWYHYYATTSENVEECRRLNPDIIVLPNEVPLAKLEYSKFNEPTKVLIRQLFVAEAKRILGIVRGKYSGVLGPQEAEKKLDYEMLLTQSEKERESIMLELKERLIRMSPEKMLERVANESEHLNRHLKFRPLGFYVK